MLGLGCRLLLLEELESLLVLHVLELLEVLKRLLGLGLILWEQILLASHAHLPLELQSHGEVQARVGHHGRKLVRRRRLRWELG